MAIAQLRRRPGRTLALLLAIALATMSFTVLTGAAETTRVEVRDTVDQNFRSSYDLLVRPPTSYTELENEQGLVRPNYQSGIFGGITTDQLAAIRALPEVEVAAPVANIGYLTMETELAVPIEPYLNGDSQQLLRIRPTWTTDRGASRFVGAPSYVYVSRNKATVLASVPYTRGSTDYRDWRTYAEVVPGVAEPVPVCTNYEVDRSGTAAEAPGHDTPFGYRDPYAPSGPSMDCYYLPTTPDGSLDQPQGAWDPSAIAGRVAMPIPVLLAAVDPTAEAQLSGLDQAIVAGRALGATEGVLPDSYGNPTIPVLAASSIDVDLTSTAIIDRVQPPASGRLSDALTGQRGAVSRVAALPGTRVDEVGPVSAADSYAELVSNVSRDYGIMLSNYWTVGASTYDRTSATTLAVRAVTNPESVYGQSGVVANPPVASDDRAVRPVTGHGLKLNQQDYAGLQVVGRYDPGKVVGPAGLSGLTAETYVSPSIPGADPASVQALGGQPLAPSTNLGGYPAQPPTLLTTLPAAAPLLDSGRFQGASATAPISVIRVRVQGIKGTDPVSRERLNQAALAVAGRTGLAVDIVAGASGVATTVALPAGKHGRPELRLLESWARKGVAYSVVDAVDRKSVALFVLILAVCSLVVGNAAAAAVRTRRIELGVLSCLGWGRSRLFGVVLTELAGIGLAAGLLGVAVALPVAAALGLSVSPVRAALAVPAAVALAVLAGIAPAVRAARATPIDAVRPLVSAPRRARAVRSVAGLALSGLRRVPGRTVLAAASLAIGVIAMTVLLAVQQAFNGTVVGSLLGNAVVVQVRAPDVAALVAIMLLGAAGVADVLYLSIREQAGEIATLRATGWPRSALSRLVVYQGLGIGLLGSLAGALLGSAAVAGFTGELRAATAGPALLAVVVGAALAALAAVVPAALITRLPVAALVAEEV